MIGGFKIIGIATRTTNKNNQAAQDLGKLWERFYSEKIFEKIPNKSSSEIFSVYTDYKSDYTEGYTAFIGVPVSVLVDVPGGLTGREFEAGNFKRFIAKGKLPDAVINTWQQIWQADKELNRKYTYDFEVYGPGSNNGEDSEVEIYISVE